ncbi:MAG TPA: hypothetical protein H9772_04205 [Candidatus Oscillibacter pullicola]|nr:hypothetical protein [Candidatus Oscillibacter pullicola]
MKSDGTLSSTSPDTENTQGKYQTGLPPGPALYAAAGAVFLFLVAHSTKNIYMRQK